MKKLLALLVLTASFLSADSAANQVDYKTFSLSAHEAREIVIFSADTLKNVKIGSIQIFRDAELITIIAWGAGKIDDLVFQDQTEAPRVMIRCYLDCENTAVSIYQIKVKKPELEIRYNTAQNVKFALLVLKANAS